MVRHSLILITGLLFSSALSAPSPPAPPPTRPDPEAAMQSFLKTYWDPERGYFLAWNPSVGFARPEGAGPQNGRYADFWWEAQLWDLTMDAYQRDPNPQYRKLIDQVYDGFVKQYPDWTNDFNDDLGWWAQGATRAYALTREGRYLERARVLFDDLWKYWTPSFGGGVLWRRSGDSQKNVATNGPLAVVAARLYSATGDKKYLERAGQLYDFVDQKLTDGGARVFDNLQGAEPGELKRWDFTYNFGNFIFASLELYGVMQDSKYLERAVKSADWTLENLTNADILLNEGTGDGGGFRGVFLRALKKLSETPALEPQVRDRYRAFLNDNATAVWNNRSPLEGVTAPNWAAPTPKGLVESLAASSALAALQLAPGPLEPGFPFGDGRYEAENSVREGPNSSVTAAGYSGRGYLNSFFKVGQLVNFDVNVPTAGRYTLNFRYSAGGGEAVRSLILAEGTPARVTFAKTPDWQSWAELKTPLELPTGPSRVTLRFDAGTGKNWLNLDKLTLELETAP